MLSNIGSDNGSNNDSIDSNIDPNSLYIKKVISGGKLAKRNEWTSGVNREDQGLLC